MTGSTSGAGPGPDLSVVIVTWNSARVVSGCIGSIRSTAGGPEPELIVVDNHSADDTLARVRAAAPGARIVANPDNRGLAAANNQGLAAAGGRHILICNPDVVFGPGAIAEMRAVMDRHPRAGWVVPRLVLEDGSPQTSAGDLPRLRDGLLGRQASRRRSEGRPGGFWWDGWAHDEERPIGRGHEAAYLVRREAVREVGPQDERYVLDWEGFDWTWRFRAAGWETWLAPGAEVCHLGGDSVRQVPLRWIASHHRGMYLYFADRMHPAWRPLLAAAFAARAAAKAAGAVAGLPLYQWAHAARRGSPRST